MSDIQNIALRHLTLSDKNVRTIRTKESIAALAANILANGLLQNLHVHTQAEGSYAVVIGGTRLAALQLLLKEKKITEDYQVACEVHPENDPRLAEISLSENVVRSAMHPADEFDAFNKLIGEGKGPAEVGAAFGKTGRYVEQRMRLAAVSPKLLAIFRKGEMTLDQLEAFTISDNHKAQEKVWRELPDWQKQQGDGDSIRDQLTEKHIDAARDSLAKFVGVEDYEKAGGGIIRDLFDEKDRGYLTDPKLLTRLADEKLKAIAEPVKVEGWKWVEIAPDFGWQDEQKMGRVAASLTKEQRAEIAKLEEQQGELSDDGDEQKWDDLEAKIGEIRTNAGFTLAQKANAGVIITIGHNGQAEIKRGLVKPEDKRAAAKVEATDKPAKGKSDQKAEGTEKSEPGMSAALIENLTAHRTAALQAKLASNPKVALVAVTHALTLSILDRSGSSVVRITGKTPWLETSAGDGIAKTAAAKEFAAATREATKGMPRESAKLWAWLMQQDQRRLLSILAVAAAHTVDAVEKKFNGADRNHANQLAEALKLDMSVFWQASAEGFFSRVSKEQTLTAVTEAAGAEIAKGMGGMKKAELAVAAEKAVRGKKWLPAMMQAGKPGVA
jgi:ParB family chromosome partitioning protein